LRPDIILDNETIVEICCTNKKTEKQIKIIEQVNLSAFEINLATLDINSSLEEIENEVLSESTNRHYLFEKKQEMHPFLKVLLFSLALLFIRNLLN
jgi:hypothetical protein